MKKAMIFLIAALLLVGIVNAAVNCDDYKTGGALKSDEDVKLLKSPQGVQQLLDCFKDNPEKKREFINNNINKIGDLRNIPAADLQDYFSNYEDMDINLDKAYKLKGDNNKITYDPNTGTLSGPFGTLSASNFRKSAGYKMEVTSDDGKNIRITKKSSGSNTASFDIELAQNGKNNIKVDKNGRMTVSCTGNDCQGIEVFCRGDKQCDFEFKTDKQTYQLQIHPCKTCELPPVVGINAKGEVSTCYKTGACNSATIYSNNFLVSGKFNVFDFQKFSGLLEDGKACDIAKNFCFKGKGAINMDKSKTGYIDVKTSPMSISGPGEALDFSISGCKTFSLFDPSCKTSSHSIWKGINDASYFGVEGDNLFKGKWTAKGLFEMNRYDQNGNYITGGSDTKYKCSPASRSGCINREGLVEMTIGPPSDEVPQTSEVTVRGQENSNVKFMDVFVGNCKVPTMVGDQPVQGGYVACNDKKSIGTAAMNSEGDNTIITGMPSEQYTLNPPYAINLKTYSGDTAGEVLQFKAGTGAYDGLYWYEKYPAECSDGQNQDKDACKKPQRIAIRNLDSINTDEGEAHMMYCNMIWEAYWADDEGKDLDKDINVGTGDNDWYDACRDWVILMFGATGYKNLLGGNANCYEALKLDSTSYTSAEKVKDIKPPICQAAVRMWNEGMCTKSGTMPVSKKSFITKVSYPGGPIKQCWWSGGTGGYELYQKKLP